MGVRFPESIGRLALRGTVRVARALDEQARPQRIVTPRHPLQPAAVRVERSAGRGSNGNAQQTAVTMWFGEGPALPSPGSDMFRGALRLGAGVVGAAALAALTVAAAQASADRARITQARVARRIGPGSSSAQFGTAPVTRL